MMGTESGGSESSFLKQWLAIGIVLVVVAIGALFAISGQMRASRTSSATDAEQVATVNFDALSDAIIAVEGMSCGACAARVKGTLKEIDGVAAVEVSLADRNVRLRYAKEKVTPERLAVAIDSLGYKATVPVQAVTEEPDVDIPPETGAGELQVTSVTIPIDGMACEYCAQSVKKSLGGIDGVKRVDVDLKKKEVRVEYSEGTATADRLVEAINMQGFKAGTPTEEGH